MVSTPGLQDPGASAPPTKILGRLCISVVIIRNWLRNPANFKGINKDHKIYVGRSTTVHNLLFCAHTFAELRNRHVCIG